jgi:V/A-type H+-transporting ATPase subunit D
MFQHTRTELIELKNRTNTIKNSISILEIKRNALISELLKAAEIYYDNNEIIKKKYAAALFMLKKSKRLDGEIFFDSIVDCITKNIDVEVRKYSLWGVALKEVRSFQEDFDIFDKKSVGILASSTFFEKTLDLFMDIINELLKNLNYEYKVKKLSNEIIKINRRINVLNEKVVPEVVEKMKIIRQHLSERERGEFVKLKMFKHITRENFI